MRDTFKKSLTAVIFAMFVALPLGAQATDSSDATAASTPATVKETLRTITSTPKGIDGELIRASSASSVGVHDATVARCIYYCLGGNCNWICW